ncbi:DUF932 domain-containing protein [uncultured Jatrophihabitans sp.]|uniref:DUF932 domain-containing protein n=1 Tax=uncultured Jatrophihabitans sp. TaxID=1610747 RepID=UPI0035CC69AD
MSHELEQFSDGTTAFAAGHNVDAWHRLGTVLPDGLTAEQVMTHAKLGGWDVAKQPVSTTLVDEHGVSTIEVAGKFITVRINPATRRREIIGGQEHNGIVGETYQPFQNERLTEYLQALTDESGATFDTAGSMRGGADVFVTMKLPTSMMIGGVDAVDMNIAVLNNHTGDRAITGLLTPVRVVCANTQRAALANAAGTFKIRHTAKAGNRVREAREALGLTFRFVEQFEQAAERMINEAMALDDFEKVCAEIWEPARDAKQGRSRTIAANRETELRKLLLSGGNNEQIRGTRWAGYQAITEYLDHAAPVHGKTTSEKATNRALRSISGSVSDTKTRAFALLSA